MKNKGILFVFIFAILLVSVSGVLADSYVISNPLATQGLLSGYSTTSASYNSQCQAGQDFILQVAPTGCTPTVVRSDLLGSQDVPVFCPITALKINPLININAVQSISFMGNYPAGVKSIGFQQKYAALGGPNSLSDSAYTTIGYATIILSQTQENNLKNCQNSLGGKVCWIEGNLTARLNYDLNGGFGIRTHSYYLPILSDNEFSSRLGQYEFFNNMGYVRAQSISSDSATIAIYSGLLNNPQTPNDNSRRLLQKYTLKVGESSPQMLLPNLACLSSVNFKLNSIVYADTTAQITVNSEVYQLRQGEKFLNDQCYISKIDSTKNEGIDQQVEIQCNTDNGTNSDFTLYIQPKVDLSVNGSSKNVSMGDKLYDVKVNGKVTGAVYLGYVANTGTLDNPHLKAYLMKLDSSSPEDKLSSNELYYAYQAAQKDSRNDLVNFLKGVSSTLSSWAGLTNANNFVTVNQSSSVKIGGADVKVIGFSEGQNVELSSNVKADYNAALDNYTTIFNTYRGEKYPTGDINTLGEVALAKKIELANSLSQKQDVMLYCRNMEQYYSNSSLVSNICSGTNYANQGVNNKIVVINGKYYEIGFDGIIQPNINQYSAKFQVQDHNTGKISTVTLGKNGIGYLNSATGETFQLTGLGDNTATILWSIKKPSTIQNAKTYIFGTDSSTIKLNGISSEGGYTVTLLGINHEKMANVVVNPSINNDNSLANFSFKIGVEKRAISLSPQMAETRAKSVNKTIDTLNGISNTLGGVVNTLQATCVATASFLTLKNLVMKSGTDAAARTDVMKYWKQNCTQQIADKKVSSLDTCYYKYSNTIDKQVSELSGAMKSTNDAVASVQSKLGKNPGTNELTSEFAKKVSQNLPSSLSGDQKTKIESILSNVNAMNNGAYTLSDLENLYTYSNLVKNSSTDTISNQDKLNSILTSIQVNNDNLNKAEQQKKEYGMPVQTITDKKTTKVSYTGETLSDFLKSTLGKNSNNAELNTLNRTAPQTPASVVSVQNQNYLFLLKEVNTATYNIKSDGNGFMVYSIDGSTGSATRIPSKDANQFQTYVFIPASGVNSVSRSIVGAKIQYYESGTYKGLPAIVPFDVKNGYYAFMPQSSSTTNVLNAYDDSGKLKFFEICKVGSTGIISPNTDKCSYQMLSTTNYGTVPGITSTSEAKTMVDNAVKAVATVSRAHSAGVKTITLNGQQVAVGAPASEDSGLSCAEVMSPKDCQVMFNVCDPVICPTSRCNFGGQYQVQNVVQSGIIGSIMLCLPNAKEGIKVPVCLTGVKAGIDGLTSTLKSYRDCLETNVKTGQTVGICDEMNSIYLCQLLWKEVTPLAKITFSKALVALKGGGTRGGGEYLSIKSAWKGARDSMNYFVSQYGANSFKSLKAVNQGQVGTNVCNNFISGTYPTGQGILGSLGVTQSPPQFTANFQEIPYTTTTNPATSQYNVYYNIYSGKNQGAYYKVYLQGSTSYYQDSSIGRLIDSGYIGPDNYASQKKEILAPSGYNKICVQVNNQEECGFKQVTTSFAQNYLTDQYLKGQATNNDIKTASQCVSGTVSAYTLDNLNLQNAISNTLNPSITDYGIIRTCSTDNPGLGTDTNIGTSSQRWIAVGKCGENTTMNCWLDTESVKNAVKFNSTATKILNSSNLNNTNDINNYLKEGGYLDNSFQQIIDNITQKSDSEQVKLLNNTLISKLFYSNHKAYIYLLRGNALYGLAKAAYQNYLDNRGSGSGTVSGQPIKYVPMTIQDIVNAPGYVSPVFYADSGDSNQDSMYYRYSAGQWQWSNETDAGNWNSMANTNTNGLSNKEVLLFKSLSEQKTYLGGLNALLNSGMDIYDLFDFRFNYNMNANKADYLTRGVVPVSGFNSLKSYFVEYNNSQKVFTLFPGDGSFYSSVKYVINTDQNLDLFYQNSWSWKSESASTWVDVSKSFVLQDAGLFGTISNWLFNFANPGTIESPSTLKESLSPKAISLLKALYGIDSNNNLDNSQRFTLGSALAFSNETTWNEVGQLHATGKFTQQNVLDFLNSLSSNYTNSKGTEHEYYSNVTKLFVNDLITKGMLSGSFNDYVVNGVPDFTKIRNNLAASSPTDLTINMLGANYYKTLVDKYSSLYGIDPNLLFAVIQQESNFNPQAVSSTGCEGIVQFCAATAYDYGLCSDKACAGTVDNRFDPEQSISAGAKYLSVLIKRYSQYQDSEQLALAAYNGGMGVVDKAIQNIESNSNLVGQSTNPSGESSSLPTTVNWQTVSSEITPSLLQSFSTYSSWSQTDLNSKVGEINDYVTKVESYKSDFAKYYSGSSTSSTPASSTTPTQPSCSISSTPKFSSEVLNKINIIKSESVSNAQKVSDLATYLNGQTVPYDASSNCWDSVDYLYNLLGLNNQCVYSDSNGKKYNIQYTYDGTNYKKEITIGQGDFTNVASNPSQCLLNKNSGNNLADSEKYADGNLNPGDLMSVVWDGLPHSVIFLGWTDKSTYTAKVFSWACKNWDSVNHKCVGNEHVYEIVSESLSSTHYPVYQYWQPV